LRNKNLDILRAIAVLLVLGRHGSGPASWKYVGWVGVDLFFVLSGFLISGLLFTEFKKTGGINWWRFFIRRGFKIYPSFYAMIFVTFVWQVVKHQEIRWKAFLPELLFYQSYQTDRLWKHTWSLAVEEHFYILLPLLLLLILSIERRRNSPDPFRTIPALWAVVAVSCLLQRYHLVQMLPRVPDWWRSVMFATHLRIDGLFFGVLLGYLHHFREPVLRGITATGWSRFLLLLVSGLLVSTCGFFAMDSSFMLSYGITGIYLGFGGILILTLYSDAERGPEFLSWLKKSKVSDLAGYFGMYSYSIYLWHLMIPLHLRGTLNLFWPGAGETAFFWSYILLSLAVGVALSRLIEYPALHVRDRFFPSPVRWGENAAGNSRGQCAVTDQSYATNAKRDQSE
jgi:peptidoglycan/LPS O-acetylase OafA/YrhL